MKMCEQILKKHSRKNSGNDSLEEIAHNYDTTTIVNHETPQIS